MCALATPLAGRLLPSIQEYVLVAQDESRIEVFAGQVIRMRGGCRKAPPAEEP